MARLFSTDIAATFPHFLQNVTITNLGSKRALAPDSPSFLLLRACEVAHYRGNDSLALEFAARFEAERNQRHQLVAVDDMTLFIDRDQTVGIAVERKANIGSARNHGLLEQFGMSRSAFLVDVETVRRNAKGNDLGTELPQGLRCDVIGRTVGAIGSRLWRPSRRRCCSGTCPLAN